MILHALIDPLYIGLCYLIVLRKVMQLARNDDLN